MSVTCEAICEMIEQFIKLELHATKRKKVVIGLSGGLDSSVTICLAVRALSSKQVFSVILPDFPITPKSDVEDAAELAKSLRIEYKIIDIDRIKSEFLTNLPSNTYAEGNLAARIRMCILYYYSFIYNGLVLGTSDKSELLLGYYTKFGDGAADLFPLGDVYKTQVKEIAEYLELPLSIRQKKSSPRLWKDQTAEEELGATYEVIDDILKRLEPPYLRNRVDLNDIDKISKKKLVRIKQIIEINAHKAKPLKVCTIGTKF
ncbi:MAG TPA: NAD+ synthase [Nitrososphaeraceae archaeon]|nr:NAD+ synthase [Nitrososphaeraceae archaeon]